TVAIVVAGTTAPAVAIATPSVSTQFKVGDLIGFSGSASDPDTGQSMPASTLTWRVYLNYCVPSNPSSCQDQLLGTFPGVASANIQAPDHELPATLRFELTATKPAAGGVPALSTTVTR